MTFKEMSNGQFAEENDTFKAACKRAFVNPTARQASKYRNRKGIAYKAKKHNPIYIQRQVEVNKAKKANKAKANK